MHHTFTSNILLHHAMGGDAPCRSHGSAGFHPQRQVCYHHHPRTGPLDGEGAVLCRNAHERLRDDPLGKHFPWESNPAAPRTPRVDFNIVAHSRPDAARLGTPLRKPPGDPWPYPPLLFCHNTLLCVYHNPRREWLSSCVRESFAIRRCCVDATRCVCATPGRLWRDRNKW